MDQKAYPKKKIKSQYYTKLYKFHMKIVQNLIFVFINFYIFKIKDF